MCLSSLENIGMRLRARVIRDIEGHRDKGGNTIFSSLKLTNTEV
jgi:hypothetical protein